MAIKSVYVCDNCNKEQIFKTSPIQLPKETENSFIHLYNPDYSGEGILVGEQHFCNTECMYEFINKEKETK
ncbi:MAG: hypothetical protein QGG97_02430 [Flavobacteriales bacterium]|jgi:hypothetical protein|nr:hypothetical protein [Flavobacteriales bacterium]|tara:strand:+ start:16769 stop:16981 length:213 start_codon:yes stop_codon:yes gene_type:complete